MDDLYQREDLLEIYKNPVNQGTLTDATVSVTERNPMCGDVLNLSLRISDENIIDAAFDGDSCAVAIISASLVTEEIIGKSVEVAKSLTKKEILDLIGVPLTTSRIKCATLVLEALKKAMKDFDLTSAVPSSS